MKKKNILIIAIIAGLLSVVLVLTIVLVSCKNCNNKKDDDKGGGTEQQDKVTNIDFVKDGNTEYKLVYPEEHGQNIDVALDEFKYFYNMATGGKISAVSDKDLTFNEEDKYLSVGKTTILQNSGVKTDDLPNDSLRLKTLGKTVIMAGGNERGSLYAVYEFLERTFNLEVYAEDELYIDTNVKDLKLKDFDVKEVPLFERRSVGLYPYTINSTFRNRMRQIKFDEGWIYWSHSHFKILDPKVYATEHPDWYSEDKSQLCLTNDEMRKEFTKNVIELVKTHPDDTYIMLGQEDINTFCTCDNCKRESDKYKNSGVMMRFINKVADDVQAYIDEFETGREFYVCTFAYHQTEQAPVLDDKLDENGNYIPIDESVKPHKNVKIMIAPIFACNGHNYFDQSHEECNKLTERVLKSWSAVAEGHIFMWIYNKIFSNYFIPFNNFSTIVDNYNILHDIGASFVYHQGNKETQAGGMQELMSYVEAKLMWDSTLNFEELVSDFINHYYREAGEFYQQYYDLIRFNYTMWMEDGLHIYNSSNKAKDVFDKKYWTQDLLDTFLNLFDKMLNSVEKYKDSDYELYNKLVLRIKKERLTVQYLYLRFYISYMPKDKAIEMVDEFESVCNKVHISVWSEKYSVGDKAMITNLVADWRKNLI